MPTQYVQFGCGLTAPPSFRNFDAGPTLWLQKSMPWLKGAIKSWGLTTFPDNIEYCDISKGFPVAPRSIDAVYCSHVLEHMTLEQFRSALRHTFLILAPGGIFRLVVPDLRFLAETYLASEDPEAASEFMRTTYLGIASRRSAVQQFARSLFGRSAHLWMWDENNMRKELADVGFVNIRRAAFGDSGLSLFDDVENAQRWENCLGMQCSRPDEPVRPSA